MDISTLSGVSPAYLNTYTQKHYLTMMIIKQTVLTPFCLQ